MTQILGMAALKPNSPLKPFVFQRRKPGPHDVVINILYCGICHSDLHQVQNHWGAGIFPMVPGHEIIGLVVETGDKVSKFTPGQAVGVGCFVDSCRTCPSCQQGNEHFCDKNMTLTYNDYERDGSTPTYGGYSQKIVVNENYVLKIPENLPLDKVAPLLCAGITTYSPLRHWKVTQGSRVGVVGMGGLGHMAVKLAHHMGAHVTVFSHSSHKKEDSIRFGASEFVHINDIKHYRHHQQPFDLILHTSSSHDDINSLLELLKKDASLVVIGLPQNPVAIQTRLLIKNRCNLTGSKIGGISETQEMLNFCSKHMILPEVEMIHAEEINQAYARLEKSDVNYRFVIDIKNSFNN